MPEPSRPVAAISTVFMDQKQRNAMSAKAGKQYEIVDIPRCAAEQYPRIVLGQNHVSIFERTLPWDHAAGILFLNEAGGMAARWDGTAYRPADTGTGLLAASTQKLWEDAARRLG
jgi:fructose-1,6-bisphosphatase/inositol monophosphatase family enzyme